MRLRPLSVINSIASRSASSVCSSSLNMRVSSEWGEPAVGDVAVGVSGVEARRV